VYCKCNYTVIHCVWKNIGHFDLGLGFERGQGQKHKPKAKSLKAKARKSGLERRPRPNKPASGLGSHT